MYFLVDYENVKNNGMRGTEYLLPQDHVLLFYSAATPSMEQCHLTDIQKSGCVFEVYKLIKQRKNGLDFYIASKLGQLFGAGLCKQAVIVSGDNGFQALRDFWPQQGKYQVTLSHCIEMGILSANETSVRAEAIRRNRLKTDIGNFYAAYLESQKLQQLLWDSFGATQFVDRLKEIEEVLKTGKTPKVIYLDSLRRFGRKDGQQIYRILKTCAQF